MASGLEFGQEINKTARRCCTLLLLLHVSHVGRVGSLSKIQSKAPETLIELSTKVIKGHG